MPLLGAIAGDIIGSVYERRPVKRTDFPLFGPGSRFTDDTVLTVATMQALREGGDYESAYRRWARRYPRAGYGGTFRRWIWDPGMGPYGSFGNGSAMRVSPVGWACSDAQEVLAEAERSAAVTHNHPEGIRGAQAVALAVFLARSEVEREDIREEIAGRSGYDLRRTVEQIRPGYRFDVTCQGSVPEAIVAFLDSQDTEHAIRLAISLGGDADTQAAIAGSIAEAFYGAVPAEIAAGVCNRVPEELRRTMTDFEPRKEKTSSRPQPSHSDDFPALRDSFDQTP